MKRRQLQGDVILDQVETARSNIEIMIDRQKESEPKGKIDNQIF